jgi:hypothetical protein
MGVTIDQFEGARFCDASGWKLGRPTIDGGSDGVLERVEVGSGLDRDEGGCGSAGLIPGGLIPDGALSVGGVRDGAVRFGALPMGALTEGTFTAGG